MKRSHVAASLLLASLAAFAGADDPARFDLVGPKVDVRVTRGSVTLPIAQVPNLQPGDRLWVKADLPSTQSNHLLLVVAFLRGTTNEPPDDWFTEIDTWQNKKTAEGTTVVVPAEAQQALIFIAPATSGDFKTLRSAVKGRPGLFIRADTDLNEASFEQQRIQHYLAAMKNVANDDEKSIQDHSAKLAATLALKPNADCFKKPVDEQVSCLTVTSAPVLLTDGHGQTIAEAITAGPSSDFINAASATQAAGGGLYSAYVGAIVDLVHLVSLLHTAQYQYIPGLAFPDGSTLNLKLNAPPSFLNPKSVIVIGLPAIQKAVLPPLRPHDPNEVTCLLQPKFTLPLEGAPLVFSTSFAHDIVLHLNRTGANTNLPLKPDAFEGGLIVTKSDPRKPLAEEEADAHDKSNVKVGSASDLTITGTIHGYWGFDRFDGPTLTLQQVDSKHWKIVGNPQLLAGKDNKLTLQGDAVGCVQHIALASNKDKDVDVNFKPSPDKDAKNTLALDVSLKTVEPGGYSLAIKQYGDANDDKVPLTAYNADIKFDDLKIHAGDNTAVLTGNGVADVTSVEIDGKSFAPEKDGSDDKTLHLRAGSGVTPKNGAEATVKLKDGRTMSVKIATEAARPGLNLLSFKATPAEKPGTLPVTLTAKDDIPLNGKLTFVVQTKNVFPRNQTIEVATADDSVHTILSLASSNLILQDEHTAVATLDPLKAFGPSAFGKLQMRPVAADGTPGNWTPLGNLVRTPQITAIQCTTTAAPTCTADGSNLFLVQSFAANKDYAKPTQVPDGFADSVFNVPTPTDGTTLYLKLRDDPAAEASITLPTPVPQPTPPPTPAAATPQTQPASPADPATPKPTATQPASSTPDPTPAPAAAETQPAPTPTKSDTAKPSDPARPPTEAPAPTQPATPPQ